MLEGPIVGLNFQTLTFGWSDAEQQPHAAWTVVHRRATPLFESYTIAIYRAHQTIGAGAHPWTSCFPPAFMMSGLRRLPARFMLESAAV